MAWRRMLALALIAITLVPIKASAACNDGDSRHRKDGVVTESDYFVDVMNQQSVYLSLASFDSWYAGAVTSAGYGEVSGSVDDPRVQSDGNTLAGEWRGGLDPASGANAGDLCVNSTEIL